MNADNNTDFTTLSWVKRELDETLGQARQALEAYVDDPGDEQLMRDCTRCLHQVHGTLRMVEMYGAAMVVEEMESLADAVIDGKVEDPNEAYGVLMRGMVQTPDYLERVQSGHRDIPVVLLPLLNDLRAARGERKLSEAVLFAPNLNADLPDDAPGAEVPLTQDAQRQQVTALRAQFQVPLLAWMRNPDDTSKLATLRSMLDQIAQTCHSTTGRRLWWIAGGVLEGLENNQLDEQRGDLRPLVGRVDRAIKQLVDGGEMALAKGDAEDLARQMLYHVAQSSSESGRLGALRKTYSLSDAVPDAAEVEHAQSAMSGHNRALLDTVSGAIKEDLLRVKDALDIFLRKPDAAAAELEPQVEVLDRVSDTLGMLGLPVPSRVIDEQHQLMQSIVDGSHVHDESTLLDIAGALLYVESSLDDHIENLGTQAAIPAAGEGIDEPLTAEARRVHDALMSEAAVNLGKVKNDITAFIETPWDHREVAQIPQLLEEIGGAMRMLDVQRPADLLNGISRFVHNELIVDRRVPTAEQMEKLADALASFEYYLEAAREHRAGRERILDVTQQSLAAIGYWPVPALRQPTEPVVADELDESVSIAHGESLEDLVVGEQPDTAPADHNVDGLRLTETQATAPPEGDAEQDWIEIEEQIEEEVPVEDDAVEGGFQAVSDEIDEDIREVFVEEFEEEIAGLDARVMAWKLDTSDMSELKNIRRTFHTLKGSGRLVGALGVGEFSWKVENMLNRVLDNTIEPSDEVLALLDHAVAALPDLLGRLKGEPAGNAPISAIMKTADKLAEGESARVEDIKPSGTRTVVRIVKRRVPRPAPEVPTDTLGEMGLQAETEGSAAEPVEEIERAEASLPAPVLPPIDPVLLDILRSEVEQHVGVMREFCAEHADAESPVRVREKLLRSVHTLSGAVAMVDIPVLVRILAPLESYLKRLRAHESELPQLGLEVLSESAQTVEEVMRQFDSDAPKLPECDGLVARISSLRDSLPEPPMAHPLFDELVEEAASDVHDASEEAAGPSAPEIEAVDLSAHSGEVAAPTDAGAADEVENADDDGHEWLRREIEDAALDLPDSGDAESGAEPAREADESAQSVTAFDADATFGSESVPLDDSSDEAAPGPEFETASDEQDLDEAMAAQDTPVEDQVEPEIANEPEAEPAAEAFAEAGEDVPAESGLEAEAELEAEPEPQPDAIPEAAAAAAPTIRFPDDPQPDTALDIPDLDADLLEIFVQEASEILDEAEGTMASLRDRPSDQAPLASLQRDLHTLKGGARMASLAPIGDLGHTMESLLEAMADGQCEVTPETIEALEHGFDLLHRMVQRVRNGMAVATPHNAIDYFLALLKGDTVEAAEDTVPATESTAPSEVDAEAEAAPVPKKAPRPRPSVERTPAVAEARAPQEMIRVRSDLLDSLVNAAGEVSIYRARLEEQISTFRFNLVEFDQTTNRLREQLRKMEIETEAQIIARYQREQEEAGESGFDPLELDRFSQLQQYSRALAESVSDLMSIQGLLDDLTRQSETLLLQQSRVSSDLQEGLMRTRMVPFDSLVPSLRRTLRQAAQETGKRAQLHISGAQGEMDRNLLERVKAPFEHMLRNAMAHGIESVEERRRLGKPAEGNVNIAVSRDATEVVITVSDDGAGINLDAVRAKAIERGLMKADAQLSHRDIYAFMLETGFSTAAEVTKLAGRGVGLDVVASEIKQLGGTLAIDSERGKGTTFTIRLPFTLAVTQAILISIGEHIFAVPMTSIQGVARIAGEDLRQRLEDSESEYIYAGEGYRLYDLASLLDMPTPQLSDEAQVPMLMTRTGDQRAAVRIDNVVGSREIVVKPVGPQVSSVPGIFGATIMGDGSVVMILDLAPLVRRHVALRQDLEGADIQVLRPAEVEQAERIRPLIMVVDDSITMRKVTTRTLERNELDVLTAKDGLDAVEKLQEHVPDLMLLDIEMPRMDGYELATYMRNDPRLKDVPIIMVTSRTGEKHRQRALELGVKRYLGKPYQEADLLSNITEALADRV